MSMKISELYGALKEAGASDEKARAVAAWEDCVDRIERQLPDIGGTLKLHGWMIGFHIAISVTLLRKLFS